MAQAFIDLIGILYKVEVENQVLSRTEKEIVKHRGEESLPVLHDLYQQATALLKQFEKNEIKLSAKLQQASVSRVPELQRPSLLSLKPAS